MENCRVLKSWWSKHNLPDDLWTDILSRFPVKYLLRFRCVSRSWKNWIDDPDFTRLHLNRFNNRPDSPILFVDSRGQCVVKNSESLTTICSLGILQSDFESVDLFRSTPARIGVSVRRWKIISSIDGLFLLQGRRDLMLWNPSIRKTLLLPSIPDIPSLKVATYYYVNFGVGFDPLIRDYKVVRFVSLLKDDVQFVAVYTLRANSFKVIDCQGEGLKNLALQFSQSSIPINGVLYGLAREYKTLDMKLVSFDLRSEVFASFELPVNDQTYSKYSKYSLTSVDDGCSLALVQVCELMVFIWVLESLGAGSWIQRHTFNIIPLDELHCYDFLCIKKNGEMLMKSSTKVIGYNLETQQQKIKNGNGLQVHKTMTYMESLLLKS